MSGQRPGQVAGKQEGGAVAGGILPCGFHGAGANRSDRLLQQRDGLQHPVPRHRQNTAHDCRRSETSGRVPRLLRHSSDQRQRRADRLILDKADLASSLVVNGVRICFTIPICTASFPVAASRRITNAGSAVCRGSFCPDQRCNTSVNFSRDKAWPFFCARGQSCPACFAAYSSKRLRRLSKTANLTSSGILDTWGTPRPSPPSWPRYAGPNGWSMRSRRLADHSGCLNTWAATHIGLPSPIGDCFPSQTAR